ncbi:MAG: hypothetical protein WBC44_04795 [Planctomycetaceae bacterium]
MDSGSAEMEAIAEGEYAANREVTAPEKPGTYQLQTTVAGEVIDQGTLQVTPATGG